MNKKYALITGGSRGIGRSICIALANIGYDIIINYNSNKVAAEQTMKTIEENGGNAELLPFDVSDKNQIDNAVEQWQSKHQGETISVLVNNAGIRMDNLLVFMSDEQWHNVVDTSLNGFFFLTRKLLKEMLTKRWGRIINIASLSGIKGLPGQTNYSAAKAAVIGASKALAQEIAARKVTVNVVAPGFISTDMTKDLDEQQLKSMIPAGRFGTPEEVASIVAFLVSDGAAYITGEVINVNGGLYT
ncbi:3-ketoacyl-ACP reductase [Bacteroidia bacterium]|nr:3-ketoacyl-ACP reductase [Bacteroidia bacterium]